MKVMTMTTIKTMNHGLTTHELDHMIGEKYVLSKTK